MPPGDRGSTDSDVRWLTFVEQLSAQPHVIDKLLADHVPNAADLCRACTTPGRGTPQKAWPCALWTLARDAKAMGKT